MSPALTKELQNAIWNEEKGQICKIFQFGNMNYIFSELIDQKIQDSYSFRMAIEMNIEINVWSVVTNKVKIPVRHQLAHKISTVLKN